MAHSTFADRMGYARWLKHLVTGVAPTHAGIGKAVKRTGQAVSGWSALVDPPSDYRVHAPLAEYLDADAAWLIEDKGPPPRPELWREWLVARKLDAIRAKAPKAVEEFLKGERDPKPAPPGRATARGGASKAAGGTRGRSRPR